MQKDYWIKRCKRPFAELKAAPILDRKKNTVPKLWVFFSSHKKTKKGGIDYLWFVVPVPEEVEVSPGNPEALCRVRMFVQGIGLEEEPRSRRDTAGLEAAPARRVVTIDARYFSHVCF